MSYDPSKLVKLKALKTLAEKINSDFARGADLTALSNKVGTVPADKTVVGMIDDVNTRIDNLPEQTDYTVTVTESTPEGYAKAYTIAQAATGLSATINIPKDMVVQSGSVVKDPAGQPAGTYLVLVLANATSDKVYINVSDLIEYVTSGSTAADDVIIAISADHKVTATLNADILAKIDKAHEHSNKALLDTYAQTEADLADAVAKKHAHSNAAVLDGISSAKVSAWDQAAEDDHTHDNKSILDGVTAQKVAAWDGAVDAQHTHANKSELDLFATGDKSKLDAAVTKLSGIADGATKVEASQTNGNVKINGTETTVYTEPADVVHGSIATDAEVAEMIGEVFDA